jgi:hypothetical protein
MNKSARLTLTTLFLFAFLAVAYGQSKSVYTWTDENGVVHYVDTPPDNPNAVEIEATEVYRPGSSGAYPEADATASADDADPAAVESYADEKRKQLDENRKEFEVKKAEREQLCAQARQQLEAIEPSRRVFFTNDQGETERLDDEERVRMVEEAKALVTQNCD